MSDRIPLAEARAAAQELVALFAPVCDLIEIGGSIRRRKASVKDIEIVMAPKFGQTQPEGLFGETEPLNLQYQLATELRATGILQDRLAVDGKHAFGKRFQRVIYRGIATDLFCCLPPASWGVILMMRTGSGDFNKRVFLQHCEGGTVLRPGLRFEGGQLWDHFRVIDTPTEASLFEAIGMPWIPPEARHA